MSHHPLHKAFCQAIASADFEARQASDLAAAGDPFASHAYDDAAWVRGFADALETASRLSSGVAVRDLLKEARDLARRVARVARTQHVRGYAYGLGFAVATLGAYADTDDDADPIAEAIAAGDARLAGAFPGAVEAVAR